MLAFLAPFIGKTQGFGKSKVRTLTYEMGVEIVSDTLNPRVKEYLLQKFGDSLVMSLDDLGNIRFDYYGSGGSGYDYSIYNVESNHYYTKWKSLDTAYHYNVGMNTLQLDEVKHLKKKKVNGVKCEVVEFQAHDKTFPRFYVNQVFYYNPDSLKVDIEQYEMLKEYFFYDYLKITNCMYFKKVIKMPDYNLTYTFLREGEKEVNGGRLFKVAKHVPLQEY